MSLARAHHLGGQSAQEIPASPPGVRLISLDHGLTIIVREDHSAPVVSAQAWCKSGSVDEGPWLGAGISHVLEHMLFKGTATRPASRIDQEIQDAGGYMNAYTSFDRTVYWINVPNTGAAVAIDILCDIMQNATLPPEELDKEKQVILREMDMLQDDPGRRSGRRLFETAYSRSPYRFPVIGHPDIFNELRREDIVAFYRTHYAPNNLFLVIVGDFQAEAVIEQIRQAFARAKAKALAPNVLTAEPRQTAPREVIETAPIELGHIHLAWHIPDIRHPDIPRLDVLATLLGSGRSSRLYREVREKAALVHAADAWTYTPGQAGLFGISSVADADKFDAARAAMIAEVERLKEELVSSDELAKAVRQFVALTLATRKTMQGQAQDLGGSWLTASDLNFSERYLAAVKRITPEDLQRAARLYFITESRSLFALLPKGAPTTPGPVIERAVERPVQMFTLPNGLRLLLKEDHRLPFVQFRAVFKGGVLAETSATNGIAALTAKLVLKGTTTRTAEAIARRIESLGGSLDSYSGNHSSGLQAEVMIEDFATGLELVADVILHPAFASHEVERERQIQLAQIKAQKDQLLQSAFLAMRRTMFGETTYGLDANGAEASVANLQVGDLRSFHQRLAVPDNGVLAIFGNIDTRETHAAVEHHFAGWQANGRRPNLEFHHPRSEVRPVPRRVSETRDKQQAVLVAGFPGATLYDADRFALDLIQEACSDLGSRLFLRIREHLGLAYFVGAQNLLGLAPGYFAFYAGTAPDQAALVEGELLKEAELLREEGLTAEELKRAKAKWIGQKKIARQDVGHQAMTAALDELYGLGYANSDLEDSQYEAVTLEQVRAAAQKYLNLEGSVVSIIKP